MQQLLEENSKLQHELTDVKRRVLQAAKRKIAEHAGAIKVSDAAGSGRGGKAGPLRGPSRWVGEWEGRGRGWEGWRWRGQGAACTQPPVREGRQGGQGPRQAPCLC